MNLCADKHDEVCYEGRICPVCELREGYEPAIADLEKEISELRNERN